jgi:hypothetical protein
MGEIVMRIKNRCSFVIYKDLEFGLKDRACFIFEMDVDESTVLQFAQEFFNGMLVEVQSVKEINQLLGINGDYYTNFPFFLPNLHVISDLQYKLISQGIFLNGGVTTQNLKKYGINSLSELDADKYHFEVFLTTLNQSASQYQRIYSSPLKLTVNNSARGDN